jgi:hypothetical protein
VASQLGKPRDQECLSDDLRAARGAKLSKHRTTQATSKSCQGSRSKFTSQSFVEVSFGTPQLAAHPI